jgi:hypothetical protein
VRKVKCWKAASRNQRRAEAGWTQSFSRTQGNSNSAHDQKLLLLRNEIPAAKRRLGGAKDYRRILLAVGLIFMVAQGTVHAQQTAPASGETLTLDQATDLALRNNHSVKVAELAVEMAGEDISTAKTFRLPSLHA